VTPDRLASALQRDRHAARAHHHTCAHWKSAWPTSCCSSTAPSVMPSARTALKRRAQPCSHILISSRVMPSVQGDRLPPARRILGG
jgi:hypothetical protein